MASATGLVVTKKFTYRDQDEYWSNKYWFQGAPPGPSTEWRTLFDALVLHEKNCYTAATTVTGGYGYNDNSDSAHAVWSVDLELLAQTVPGALTVPAANVMAGDQAGMFEFQTQRKNSRGKWIYLRKYMHDGGIDPLDRDRIDGNTQAAYDGFIAALKDGTWSSGRIIRSQKQDETFNWGARSEWVTTRTLKRRGKRP